MEAKRSSNLLAGLAPSRLTTRCSMFHAAMQHVCVRSMMTRRYLATATADPTRHANSESTGHGKALQKGMGHAAPTVTVHMHTRSTRSRTTSGHISPTPGLNTGTSRH